MASTRIQPNTWLFLRLPSDTLKCIEIKPNTIIDVGKLGSFPSNLLFGRPYYYTYEILEKEKDEAYSRLRVVKPEELNAEVVAEEATPSESRGEPATPARNGGSDGAAVVDEDAVMAGVTEEPKTNRLTVDDATRQALSQQEIEQLKQSSTGREVIDKILANHAGLDEKTVFSKAKYMLRKRSKYLKRFTALPMDIGNVISYIFEKEPQRILEMREETLGLVMAWSNAHVTPEIAQVGEGKEAAINRSRKRKRSGGGRWLVVDETGGLLVAGLAERMGILHKQNPEEVPHAPIAAAQENGHANSIAGDDSGSGSFSAMLRNEGHLDHVLPAESISNGHPPKPEPQQERSTVHRDFPPPVSINSITLLHPAVQPNISLLKYFGYDANIPDQDHPLHTHLKSLSWLQLLHSQEDPTYREPETVPEAELAKMKSGKRSTYFKKRRRWERCRTIVDEAREGGFDGLVIASSMDPATILPHTVPLVRGGGHVVVYSPTTEPLVHVMDLYSKERRAAYIACLAKEEIPDAVDFPVDPRLLLAPTLQTTRIREWQVLPGRTHPMMTSRGGSEGYVFTGRKVIPLEGGVDARGNYSAKKKKVEDAIS